MTEIWISIDGPENINNYSRKYIDGSSSYSDVVNNIKLLQKNNIKVNINSVITPKYINLLEIIEFFQELNVNKLNFQIVRSEKIGFTIEGINEFLKKFDELLEVMYKAVVNKNYFYISFLKDHLFFKFLRIYYTKNFSTKRCWWGSKLSINADGELYHCDSTAGLENKIGTFTDDIKFEDIDDGKHVDNYEKCHNCFAKNICGGTCYYISLKKNIEIDEVECLYRKGLIQRALLFYAKMLECNEINRVMNILLSKKDIKNFISENKNLPVDKQFILEQEKFNQIEGWFSPVSRAVFDSLLNLQKKEKISGHCCEIGVWKGKSAIEISKFIGNNEKLLLIDPLLNNNKYELYNSLSGITTKNSCILEIICKCSEDYNYYADGINYFNRMRFIHIDGCHTGENVYNDLKMADKFLCKNGIVVIDDFFNSTYPQITEAIYKYIFNNEYSFKIFLIGANKAYLCRPSKFYFYHNFCMDQFQKEMLSRGFAIKISKTSPIADSLTFSFSSFDSSVDLPSGKQGTDWEPTSVEFISAYRSLS